ncbi:hypothetical protein QYF50_02165 [Paenibacillus vini]|uniref:hypothetical protein n=1 Tax=Paenibacillus vini TaxID=1476024 RepID=UPI0025B72701|nr:hypothetical protein [Paenibacillus vini]MDN4066685.1 hypothetical protein [Paenibacillus vini]
MNNQTEYQHYISFIRENFPQSAYLLSEEGLVKKLFTCIHNSLIISDIFSSIRSLNSVCTLLLADQKLIYLKTLYTLPNNDDFQFYSIMRANVENLLRILLCAFKPEITYQEVKETSFSQLNELLDMTYLNQKYKVELSELYSYFGTFSKNIHRISLEKNTNLFLKEMMTKTLEPKSLETKIKSLKKIKNILVYVFLDVYKVKSGSFDTPQLSKLHSILGEAEYEKLPLFE